MAAQRKAGTQATPVVATTPAPALDINALKAQQKALREQIKQAKQLSDGKITAIEFAEPDANTGRRAVMIDVEEGDHTRLTEAKEGRTQQPYAFSCDSIRFKHPDLGWCRTGAIFAIRDSDQSDVPAKR